MASHFKIPLVNPFKFVPSTANPGIHFDDAWACEQVKSFEKKVVYKQKWVKTDTTTIQVTSSTAPDPLKLYRLDRSVAKTFNWTVVFAGVSYSVYEATFDVSDVAEGVYFLFTKVTIGEINWPVISELIHSKASWPNTLLFTYYNSYNRDGVAWTTGIKMKFRCEAAIMEFEPLAEVSDHVNQTNDREIIDAVASRQFKLYIGTARGVAPYVLDILNRIFIQDYVDIGGLQYCRSGKWEISRANKYSLIGGSIDIVPSKNMDSLEFADTTPLLPGIVIAYSFDTGFFGPGSIVPIEEVEENG